jgi:hypothetical protein
MTPLSSGTYVIAKPAAKCSDKIEITLNSPYRNGESDVSVTKVGSNQKTQLKQWPGQLSAATAGAMLTPDRDRDGWVSFSVGEKACVYKPE